MSLLIYYVLTLLYRPMKCGLLDHNKSKYKMGLFFNNFSAKKKINEFIYGQKFTGVSIHYFPLTRYFISSRFVSINNQIQLIQLLHNRE